MIKLELMNIRSLTSKALVVNDMITDYNLDMFCLTESWLKADDYISFNESTPNDYCYKNEPHLKGKGGGVAVFYSNTVYSLSLELLRSLVSNIILLKCWCLM